jgi:hypothetical protein
MKNWLVRKKIYKRLTLLDLIVLMLLFLAVVLFLIFFSREKSTVYVYTVTTDQEWSEVPYPNFYWIANSIVKGSMAYSSTGSKVAEVVEVDNTERGGARRYSRLKLKVYAIYDKRTKQYRLGDRSLQVGNSIELNIGNTKYKGMIIYVGDSLEPAGYKHELMEVNLKVEQIEPWLALTYEEPFVVKNTEDKKVFEIISVEIRAAELSVPTDRGIIVRSYDPRLKDVFIKAKARVRCQEGICYFNEVLPIKSGLPFWVQSDSTIIDGGKTRIMSAKKIEDLNEE